MMVPFEIESYDIPRFLSKYWSLIKTFFSLYFFKALSLNFFWKHLSSLLSDLCTEPVFFRVFSLKALKQTFSQVISFERAEHLNFVNKNYLNGCVNTRWRHDVLKLHTWWRNSRLFFFDNPRIRSFGHSYKTFRENSSNILHLQLIRMKPLRAQQSQLLIKKPTAL